MASFFSIIILTIFLILGPLLSCSRNSREITTQTNPLNDPGQYSLSGTLYLPKTLMNGQPLLINFNGQTYNVVTYNSPAIVVHFINALYSNPFTIPPYQQNNNGYFYRILFSGIMSQGLCPDPTSVCNNINLTSIKGY